MVDPAALGAGWAVWNEGEERLVLAYRPDVFDGNAHPAPCLPTVYVTRGRRTRRPRDPRRLPPDAPWRVTLFLEPDVSSDRGTYDGYDAAVDAATATTRAFAGGELEYRGLYQVPREPYLDRLDELTGRDG